MSITNINNVYLAGPFFNQNEISNIEYTEKELEKKGIEFFSPMRYGSKKEHGTHEWAHELFEMDRNEIKNADAVVALYYGSNGDTGTAWECGYASAIGKPVILIHVHRNNDSNIMMHCGCTTNIFLDELKSFDFKTMPVYEFNGKML